MSQSEKKESKSNEIAEVLYQKIGEKWYAYSIIDEEVFMGAIPDETLEEIKNIDINAK